MADPAAIETVLKRWSTPRLNIGSALAADGKRFRGANRNGDGYFETATRLRMTRLCPLPVTVFMTRMASELPSGRFSKKCLLPDGLLRAVPAYASNHKI